VRAHPSPLRRPANLAPPRATLNASESAWPLASQVARVLARTSCYCWRCHSARRSHRPRPSLFPAQQHRVREPRLRDRAVSAPLDSGGANEPPRVL